MTPPGGSVTIVKDLVVNVEFVRFGRHAFARARFQRFGVGFGGGDADLADGDNVFRVGTYVVNLQWCRLVSEAADVARTYHQDKRNEKFDSGSLIRFDHRAFDLDHFKLPYVRGNGGTCSLQSCTRKKVMEHLTTSTD